MLKNAEAGRQKRMKIGKTVQIVCWVILVATLIVMVVNQFGVIHNDWIIRGDGIAMIVCIFVISLGTRRGRK